METTCRVLLVCSCLSSGLLLISPPGRIAGQDGKTKFTIENTSRTRIVLADTFVDFLLCALCFLIPIG